MSFWSPDSTKKVVASQGGSAYGNYMAANHNRGFDWRLPAAMVAAPLIGSAAPALFGGGGAAAGAGGAGGYSSPGIFGSLFGGGATGNVIAPAVKSGLSLSSFLNAPATGLGVQGLFSILGNRAQGKAQQQASLMQLSALDRQLAADAANRADQMKQFEATQTDARAANAAQNELRRRELESAEADRAFQRKLLEDREARLAPYRATAEQARMTLAAMLGRR